MKHKIGSLFDGSGGFPPAASMCGIEPTWAAEIEPYPIAVTRSRFPNMKHLGSVTDVKGNEVEPVDVITFGSPCQDLSVAGKRAGLKHTKNGDEETTRSGLFMEAIRIIKEMREATNGVYPRFAVWENVPGAFSSNKGEDFRIVLEEFVKVCEPTAVMPTVPKNGWPYADSYCGDGWSISYRVFDAQFWGVPQRRRRIYLVADFRGQCAGKVSFEREGLRGYFAQSGAQREEAAGDAESGVGTADFNGISDVIPINTMIATRHKQLGRGTGFGLGEMGDAQFTISAGHEHAVCYSFDSLASNSMKSTNPHSGCRQVEVSKCLDTTNPDPSKNQGGVAVVEQVPYTLKIRTGVAVDSAGKAAGKGALIQENKAATLAVAQDQYLFQPILDDQGGSQISVRTDGKAPTLRAEMHGNVPAVVEQYLFENHSQDSRYKGPLDVSPMLPAQLGTGGNNQPFVVEESPVYCIQGNGIDRADTAGCNGKGWKEDTCYTLNTIDRPAVAYLASGKDSVGTLMANAGTKLWLGNQEAFSGDYHIIEETEPPAVRYIVRRLTPTECARLQGFPDKWGHPDQKEDFTDEEYRFWLDVRNTHATVIGGKEAKEYTKEQMLTWYNKLHTDSAEYKLWGNGIALPCALYVLEGIAEVFKED